MKLYINTNKQFNDINELLTFCYPTGDYFREYTYFDKECTQIQCSASRRSFEDLLSLCKTYFPETTEKDLMKTLIDMGMRYYRCGGIGKIVFHYRGDYLVKDGFSIGLDNLGYVEETYLPKRLREIHEEVLNQDLKEFEND